MKSRAVLLGALTIPLAVGLFAGSVSGASAAPRQQVQLTASQKPGPPPELAEGQIKADIGQHNARLPCLTATAFKPGAHVTVAPCTTKLNAAQRWKIARFKAIIVVGLMAHPGLCLSAHPDKVTAQRKFWYIAKLYDCGQGVEITPGGLLLGHIGGIYNTIIQAHGGKLLSAARKASGINRYAQWRPSNGNIPYAQVWLFPKFKAI